MKLNFIARVARYSEKFHFLHFKTIFRSLIFRVPEDDVIKYGSLKVNGENCMDTVGHKIYEGVGIYNCHGQGGNQVRFNLIALL